MSGAPYRPSVETVAVDYLKLLTGRSRIATSLPTSFESDFLTISSVGGTSDLEVGLRYSVVTLDAWATSGGTRTNPKPRWNAALDLIEEISELLVLPREAVVVERENYRPARVFSTTRMISEPLRIEGDPQGYARFSADLELDWIGVR